MPKPRMVWLNGRLVDEGQASVSVWDRGFLFGDGVYELVRYFRAAPASGRRRVGVGLDLHVARLHRSLGLARIAGFDAAELSKVCDELLDANDLDDASVYVQVTRGSAGNRAHVPTGPLTPTVFACATPCEPIERFVEPAAIRAITLEDQRWRLCQIKTVSLMGNILALLEADEQGAVEALLHRDGFLGEGAYTNVFAVFAGTLVTPPVDADPPILHGVTRAELIDVADRIGLRTEVRPVPIDDMRRADELMVTSSRRLVNAVVALDDQPVSGGQPGPITRLLFAAMRSRITDLVRGAVPAPA